MVKQRIDFLRKKLSDQNLDGLLVSNFYNILYLTGFKTLTKDERESWVLVTKNSVYLFSDGRYEKKYQISNIKNQKYISKIKNKLITSEKGLITHLQEINKQEKIFRLGVEGDDLTVNELRGLEEKLATVSFIATDKIILKQRETKDKQEIEKIKKACLIGDQCLKEIIKTIKIDQKEKEIAFKIEFWLKEKGYQPAFTPLVAINENSAVPHYDTVTNGEKKVKDKSLILIDFGVNYQDYLSDMTRMIFFGKPTNEEFNIYQKLLSVQQKTLNQIPTNVGNYTGKVIDEFCRLQIASYGLPEYSHSTGHGVGLEIHEYPKISQKSKDILRPNQIFTIEPGVYFPGKWGMRVEDLILVDRHKQPRSLNKFSKSLLIL